MWLPKNAVLQLFLSWLGNALAELQDRLLTEGLKVRVLPEEPNYFLSGPETWVTECT
jgi:hypothetical protein